MREEQSEFIASALEKARSNLAENTVLGAPIYLSKSRVVVPINRVVFCYGMGSTEYHKKSDDELKFQFTSDIYPYGGEVGGLNIKPEALLLIDGDKVRIIKLDDSTIYDKALDLAAEIAKKAFKK